MKKTVIITGSSRGIGAACARHFALNGYNTVINYNKSKAEAEALKNKLLAKKCNVITVKADMGVISEIQDLFKTTIETYGRIDCLVANAGIDCYGLINDVDEETYDRVMNVNLKGVFFACREAVNHMLQFKSGRIITVSSIWGQTGAAYEALYSTSKAGVIGLTKALAKELAPSNITVNCVAPGIIETDMACSFSREEKKIMADSIPLGRFGKAEEIAMLIYYLAEKELGYLTGQVISASGGLII